jgi:hypothetical protein
MLVGGDEYLITFLSHNTCTIIHVTFLQRDVKITHQNECTQPQNNFQKKTMQLTNDPQSNIVFTKEDKTR